MEIEAITKYGIAFEADVPYSESVINPYSNFPLDRIYMDDWYRVPSKDIEGIKRAIYEHGVVDAAVMATSSFGGYQGGVFTGDVGNCPLGDMTSTNHAISLVGYGYDKSYGDYFILRNSWGPYWGEGGYMRIAANSSAVQCAVVAMNYTNKTQVSHFEKPISSNFSKIKHARFATEYSLPGAVEFSVTNSDFGINLSHVYLEGSSSDSDSTFLKAKFSNGKYNMFPIAVSNQVVLSYDLPSNAFVGEVINFSFSNSSPISNFLVSYGDGMNSSSLISSHVYSKPGYYKIVITYYYLNESVQESAVISLFGQCTVPTGNLDIQKNTTLCFGEFFNTSINMKGENIVLTCQNTILNGYSDSFIGLKTTDCINCTIRGCEFESTYFTFKGNSRLTLISNFFNNAELILKSPKVLIVNNSFIDSWVKVNSQADLYFNIFNATIIKINGISNLLYNTFIDFSSNYFVFNADSNLKNNDFKTDDCYDIDKAILAKDFMINYEPFLFQGQSIYCGEMNPKVVVKSELVKNLGGGLFEYKVVVRGKYLNLNDSLFVDFGNGSTVENKGKSRFTYNVVYPLGVFNIKAYVKNLNNSIVASQVQTLITDLNYTLLDVDLDVNVDRNRVDIECSTIDGNPDYHYILSFGDGESLYSSESIKVKYKYLSGKYVIKCEVTDSYGVQVARVEEVKIAKNKNRDLKVNVQVSGTSVNVQTGGISDEFDDLRMRVYIPELNYMTTRFIADGLSLKLNEADLESGVYLAHVYVGNEELNRKKYRYVWID